MSGESSSAGRTCEATFVGGGVHGGQVACPECEQSTIHLTGHFRQVDPEASNFRLGASALCECGQALELLIGNHEGDLVIQIRRLGW